MVLSPSTLRKDDQIRNFVHRPDLLFYTVHYVTKNIFCSQRSSCCCRRVRRLCRNNNRCWLLLPFPTGAQYCVPPIVAIFPIGLSTVFYTLLPFPTGAQYCAPPIVAISDWASVLCSTHCCHFRLYLSTVFHPLLPFPTGSQHPLLPFPTGSQYCLPLIVAISDYLGTVFHPLLPFPTGSQYYTVLHPLLPFPTGSQDPLLPFPTGSQYCVAPIVAISDSISVLCCTHCCHFRLGLSTVFHPLFIFCRFSDWVQYCVPPIVAVCVRLYCVPPIVAV